MNELQLVDISKCKIVIRSEHNNKMGLVACSHMGLLKDIKIILNVLCINNLKCEHNCKCNEQPIITYILLGCVLVTNIRVHMWSIVENTMPLAGITTYSGALL